MLLMLFNGWRLDSVMLPIFMEVKFGKRVGRRFNILFMGCKLHSRFLGQTAEEAKQVECKM